MLIARREMHAERGIKNAVAVRAIAPEFDDDIGIVAQKFQRLAHFIRLVAGIDDDIIFAAHAAQCAHERKHLFRLQKRLQTAKDDGGSDGVLQITPAQAFDGDCARLGRSDRLVVLARGRGDADLAAALPVAEGCSQKHGRLFVVDEILIDDAAQRDGVTCLQIHGYQTSRAYGTRLCAL